MREQCWKDFAYPERRCKREAHWRSPPELCSGIGSQFMSACRWCDEHKYDGDVLIERSQEATK